MNPDSDTVCSAITYAHLYKQFGIDAKAMISGKINNETKYILNKANINIPDILEDATNKNIIIVDNTSFGQTIKGMDKANIVAIIDHHALGNITTSTPLYIRNTTASIIALEYIERGIKIDSDIATILISAILSDTNNFTLSSSTEVDK